MRKMGKDVVTSLRVDEELWRKARVYAIENRLTMKELIETLISMELKERRIKGLKGNEQGRNQGN